MADNENNTSLVCTAIRINGKLPVFAIASNSKDTGRVLGATFMRKKGVWLAPAYPPYVTDVVSDIKIVHEHIHFDAKAEEIIAEAKETEAHLKRGEFELNPNFKFITDPYEHQVEGLKRCIVYPRSGLLYDCGLGKTKVVVDSIRYLGEPALVLVPTIGVRMWVDEVAKHSDGQLRAVTVDGSVKAKRRILEECAGDMPDIVIMSYDVAKRYLEQVMALDYQLVVADESHYLRTHTSARTKAAIKLSKKAYRRIILSGTPSLGNPLHLWGQLTFLAPFITYSNYMKYKYTFVTVSKNNKNIVTGFKNLELLNSTVSRVCLRRTKEECLDLPERTIIEVPFSLTPKQRSAYNTLAKTMFLEISKMNAEFEAANTGVVIQKLLQILSGFFIVPYPEICDNCPNVDYCVAEKIKPYTKQCTVSNTPPAREYVLYRPNPKLDAFAGVLNEILVESTNKVIVWANFTKELDLVQEYLETNNIEYTRVDGSNSGEAQRLANEFNEDPEQRVWLAQIATGVAITLTSAAYTIYYGLNYNLDEFIQSMERNYRIGQKNPVFVYVLTCKNSVLDYVQAALRQKENISRTITDPINCAACPRGLECMGEGIHPFDTRCIYSDKANKIKTMLRTL